ncbi:MAG TPA: dienelactone hydrolase family protein [Ignavibacteria bacterium]|nr:dienelactone hydrolase family protein [Ignavibacteria bacterium]
MKKLIFVILFLSISMGLKSEIVTKDIEYKDGNMLLQGYLAYDNSNTNLRPGILIVHQWKGLSDYEKMRARELAELGYVAFAIDMYGKDIRPESQEEAGKEAGKYYGDVNLMRERVNSGLTELKKMEFVNTNKIAAIGYCFGGGCVLELARSGAEIKGVVSFHGSLGTQNPADAKNIKCKISVQHGAIDPFVKEESVIAFKKEMEDASVDYVLTEYSGAVHSFTMESAGNDVSKGSAYNANADKRSWEAMKDFFNEIFAD